MKMALWQKYLRPKNLAEALDAFASAPRPLAPIAGGTDLLLDLEQGRHPAVQTLVDVSEIAEMMALEIRDDRLFVGASVPVNRIVSDPLTVRHARALCEACELIAGPQVRNVATLGGNVAHALPAADGTIGLLVFDTEAEIAGPGGTRRVPFPELFDGPGKSSLKAGQELLVGFYLDVLRVSENVKTSSAFKRIMRPQGVALPILNCAVWLARQNETIIDLNIAVGPGSATPFRATQAESILRGKVFSDAAIEAAFEAVLVEANFRDSARRASADYRRQIIQGLFKDTLMTAWDRTGESR